MKSHNAFLQNQLFESKRQVKLLQLSVHRLRTPPREESVFVTQKQTTPENRKIPMRQSQSTKFEQFVKLLF
jgi:hypothetical protein